MTYHNRKIDDATPAELERLSARKALASLDGKPKFRHVSVACHRCGGAGGWQGWPGYTCYRCAGERNDPTLYGVEIVRPGTDEWNAAAQRVLDSYFARVDRKNEKARKEAEAKNREMLARFDALVSADETLSDAVALIESGDAPEIVSSIVETCKERGEISERQREVLAKVIRENAEKAARPTLEEGRRVLVGTVRNVKEVWTSFGAQFKAVVALDDGNVVYGTHGRNFPAVGGKVRFVAAIERSADDEHFGFYKRPTKVECLSA
jgi:hypothetical protein